MKNINEMNIDELSAEIQNLVSFFDDRAQAIHSAAYLTDLAEAFCKKSAEYMTGIPA